MGLIHERWLDRIFRPLGIGILFGCVAQGLVGVAELILQGWQAEYLVVLAGLAAVEAQASYVFLRRRSRVLDRVWLYRATELLLLYFVLQAVGLAAEGRAGAMLGAIDLSSKRIVTFLIIAGCWLGSTDTARDLWNLGEPPIHDVHYRAPADHLVGRFFVGAGAVLVATGYSELGTGAFTNPSHAPVSALLLNVLIYFVVGVIMLGQIRYSALVNRWHRSDARIGGDLTRRWVRWTLVLVGLAALAAAVLPTTYTVGLLDALRLILLTAGLALQLLTLLIVAPLGWLLSHLLASGTHHHHPPPAAHHRIPLPRPHSARGPGFDVVSLLRSLLFWAVIIIILVSLVRGYLASGGKLVRRLGTVLALVANLAGLIWHAVWDRFRGGVESLSRAVQRMLPGAASSSKEVTRRRLRRTGSAREQVQYYFLTLIARAARQGAQRRGSDTPREYAVTATALVPDVQQDIRGLTEAFIEARYSNHEVGDIQVQAAKRWWQRVRSALRSLRATRSG